ncbi:MAG: DUF2177 family protein [Gemmatimonadales bacterium]|jgi:uncharacterized membrane protein
MNLAKILKLYASSLGVFLVVDLLWLGVIARGFYRRQLGPLLRPDVRWAPALIFYLLFVAGVLIFAVIPALERDSWGRAIVFGALFGAISYATYDLTNLATLKGFPPIVAIVDISWGAFLAAFIAGIAYKLGA